MRNNKIGQTHFYTIALLQKWTYTRFELKNKNIVQLNRVSLSVNANSSITFLKTIKFTVLMHKAAGYVDVRKALN